MPFDINMQGQALVLAQEALAAGFEKKLADRNSFLGHEVFRAGYLGNISGQNSNVLSRAVYSVDGTDPLQNTGENVGVGNTPFTPGKVSCTVTRQSKKYGGHSDIVSIIQKGRLSRQTFIDGVAGDYQMTACGQICSVLDGFSTPVGTSGAPLTVAVFQAALAAAQAKNLPGPYLCILSPKAWSQLVASASTATGTIPLIQATQEMMKLRGNGYQGSWLNVDIFVSSKVVTMNGGLDYANAILGAGSIVWGDGDFDPSTLISDQTLIGKVLFEVDRNRPAGSNDYIEHMYFGCARGQDGVTIVSGV